jgi:hypothetical protein
MPRLGFEPTIPVFERAKTFHALDRAVTMIVAVGLKSLNLKGFHFFLLSETRFAAF